MLAEQAQHERDGRARGRPAPRHDPAGSPRRARCPPGCRERPTVCLEHLLGGAWPGNAHAMFIRLAARPTTLSATTRRQVADAAVSPRRCARRSLGQAGSARPRPAPSPPRDRRAVGTFWSRWARSAPSPIPVGSSPRRERQQGRRRRGQPQALEIEFHVARLIA
jgi:hypothetical protein